LKYLFGNTCKGGVASKEPGTGLSPRGGGGQRGRRWAGWDGLSGGGMGLGSGCPFVCVGGGTTGGMCCQRIRGVWGNGTGMFVHRLQHRRYLSPGLLHLEVFFLFYSFSIPTIFFGDIKCGIRKRKEVWNVESVMSRAAFNLGFLQVESGSTHTLEAHRLEGLEAHRLEGCTYTLEAAFNLLYPSYLLQHCKNSFTPSTE
jgi:hypothetical protein